jgi:PST family polysaccharide transporter
MADHSYRSVLKSTSVVGAGAFLNMLISMIRIKFVAVLLGPYGVGLMGLYTAIVSMVSTVSSMGIDTSGVRKIAEAHGLGDEARISRVVTTLHRTVWLTGLIGLVIMIAGCTYLSRIALGSDAHAVHIAWLGLAVLLGNVTIGHTCLLQGTRRIGVMAKVGVVGSFNGLVLSVPCFYFWGIEGIVPGLILAATALLATTWWFAHQIRVDPVEVSWSESRTIATQLLHFGIPIMASGVVAACSGYFVRALLIRQVGLEGVGVWQAAFNLSGIFANFVLGAMVADYYPRLVAVSGDNGKVRDVVNAQTEIAMFLAVPGMAATIIFAPLAVLIFYTGRFDAAVEVLRLFVFGLLCRVISWPMGLVILARGMGKTYFSMELCGNLFYIVAVWICVDFWGLAGAGWAFFIYHLFNLVMTAFVLRVTGPVTWTAVNLFRMVAACALLASIGMVSQYVADPGWRYGVNLLLLLAMGVYCLSQLSQKSGVALSTSWEWVRKGLDRKEPPDAS